MQFMKFCLHLYIRMEVVPDIIEYEVNFWNMSSVTMRKYSNLLLFNYLKWTMQVDRI